MARKTKDSKKNEAELEQKKKSKKELEESKVEQEEELVHDEEEAHEEILEHEQNINDPADDDHVDDENEDEEAVEQTDEADPAVNEEDYESLRQKLINEYNLKRNPEEDSLEEEAEDDSLEEDDHEDDLDNEEDHEDDFDENQNDHEDEDSFEDRENEDNFDDFDEEFRDDHELNENDENLDNPQDKDLSHASVPQDQHNLDSDINQLYQNSTPDIDQGHSKVSVSGNKNIIMLVVIVIGLAFIGYKFITSANPEPKAPEPQVDTSIPITTPVQDTGQPIIVPQLPKAPEVPKLTAPTPPPVPTPPIVADLAPPPTTKPTAPSAGEIFTGASKADLEKKKARMSSNMMVGGLDGKANNKNQTKSGQSLTILQRNNDQVVATNIGDLRRVIAQGKIIDATLETAINTDIPGSVRALVSMDVFSESGNNILIPRGSRLIGNYASTTSFGINRLRINWTRLIRPDGVDINIASPGVDPIGRAGVPGDLNNHILGTLTAAVLTSAIDIGVAAFADSQTNTNTTTSTYSPTVTSTTSTGNTTVTTPTINTGGTVTTGSTPTQTDTAYQDAVSKIATTGQNVVQQFQNMKPTITIDQGAPLKVFVNKDLVFPGNSANLIRVIE